jgi:hypothetical protein
MRVKETMGRGSDIEKERERERGGMREKEGEGGREREGRCDFVVPVHGTSTLLCGWSRLCYLILTQSKGS